MRCTKVSKMQKQTLAHWILATACSVSGHPPPSMALLLFLPRKQQSTTCASHTRPYTCSALHPRAQPCMLSSMMKQRPCLLTHRRTRVVQWKLLVSGSARSLPMSTVSPLSSRQQYAQLVVSWQRMRHCGTKRSATSSILSSATSCITCATVCMFINVCVQKSKRWNGVILKRCREVLVFLHEICHTVGCLPTGKQIALVSTASSIDHLGPTPFVLCIAHT